MQKQYIGVRIYCTMHRESTLEWLSTVHCRLCGWSLRVSTWFIFQSGISLIPPVANLAVQSFSSMWCTQPMPVSGVNHFLPPGPLHIFLHGTMYLPSFHPSYLFSPHGVGRLSLTNLWTYTLCRVHTYTRNSRKDEPSLSGYFYAICTSWIISLWY